MTNIHPTKPFDAIIFDCDGTLTSVEGVDELAYANNVGPEVCELTYKAMEHGELTRELYDQRLKMINPTKKQLDDLGQDYIKHITRDAGSTIETLKKLGKTVFIISAGLSPAVDIIGRHLGIDDRLNYSVSIFFNEDGSYKDFDHHSPLITSHGKTVIIKELLKHYPSICLIGDGMNDLATKPLIDRFIGFGGHFVRQNVKDGSEYYLEDNSLMPVLRYALTDEELSRL